MKPFILVTWLLSAPFGIGMGLGILDNPLYLLLCIPYVTMFLIGLRRYC